MSDLLETRYCTVYNCDREAEIGETCFFHSQSRLPPLVFEPCGSCPDRAGCIELKACATKRMAEARGRRDQENVTLHPHAEAQADATLEQLKDGLAEGVVIEVGQELPEASQRLMNTLGAKVIVKSKEERVETPAPANRRGYWTRERIIEAIQHWVAEHGSPPTQRDWARSGPDHPADGTLPRVFGSRAAAIRAAGFEAYTRGGGPGRGGRPASPPPNSGIIPEFPGASGNDPERARPALVATNGQPGTYAERARAVTAAAERLDNAQAEVESARTYYEAALEAARA